jgi:hypothetical protein
MEDACFTFQTCQVVFKREKNKKTKNIEGQRNLLWHAKNLESWVQPGVFKFLAFPLQNSHFAGG